MREPAVPAPDSEMPAADSQVMGTIDMAVPAIGGLDKLPEIITADFCEGSFLADIFNSRHKNPGCTAVITCNLCLVRHGLDDLVSDLFAMIAVRTIFREDETVAHGR